MKTYTYDIEVFRNYFSVIFIDIDIHKDIIKAYEIADMIKDYNTKFEILNNYIKPHLFVIYKDRNDISLLNDFMKTHKNLVGYNNFNYDNNVLDFIIQAHSKYLYNPKGYNKINNNHITDDLYDLSQELINYGNGWQYNNNRYFKRPYSSIDLQKLLYLDKKFISLKQVAVQLKHYRLEDLPIPYDSAVEDADLNDIIDYNVNDVIITHKLYHNQLAEIELRQSISKIYNVNVLSESRSGTGNKLMMNFYSRESGIEIKDFKDLRSDRRVIKFDEIISPKIKFIDPIFVDCLRELKNKKLLIGAESIKDDVIFNFKKFTIATGGLHSVDKPNIYKSTDKILYKDADATSFYPYIILNEESYPEHLDKDIYLGIIKKIVEDRTEAKRYAQILNKADSNDEDIKRYAEIFKIKGEALKIVINSVYGKTGEENSFLYDLKAMYKVTINGQLYLLMLIDMLADIGINCVSANTDGIICEVPIDKLNDYYRVCKEWEDYTKFSLEYTDYEKYVCYAVNDYIAIKTGYNKSSKSDKDKAKLIKEKGLFITTTQIDKGYNKPIIAKALISYYADGVLPEDYINNHKDIYDFCISIKTGSDFIKEFHTLKAGEKHIEILQKNIRYYISNKGGIIMKRYETPIIDKKGIKREYIALHKGLYSTLFNDYIHYENMSDYNINYNHYISETYKMIQEISNVVSKKMKKQSYGGLFDNIN